MPILCTRSEDLTSSGSPKEQLESAIQDAVIAIMLETSTVGEMIVQLGGETGLVPGPLTADQLLLVKNRLIAAAAEVCISLT